MSYVETQKAKAFIMVYNNTLVNDLHKLGFHCLIKPDLEKMQNIVDWIDKNLIEVIVIKRTNEKDYLAEVKKRKLHYVITYDTQHFPEEKKREVQIELYHREQNFIKNYLKKQRRAQKYKEDAQIDEIQE